MKKIIQYTIWILSINLTVLFGAVWIKRLSLPYNSEGRYLDQVTEIIYTDSGVISYGFLTLLFLIIGLIFLILKLR